MSEKYNKGILKETFIKNLKKSLYLPANQNI